MVRFPAVQTYLTQQIAKQVSANLNAKFEVGRVDIVFFNRILLRDIHIEDQQGDTLLNASRISVTVQKLSRAGRNIVFNQVNLYDAHVNIHSDSDSVLNLQFIIDAVSFEDPTQTRWNFSVNAVHFKDSRFSYRRYNPETREYGINFQDIGIERFNLLVNRIHTTTDSLHFNISYMNLEEKSGFKLDHFTADNSISKSGIDISNLRIITPGSRLDLDHYRMTFSDFEAFSDFVNRVTISSSFNPSLISFNDISYFSPSLKDVNHSFTLSGEVTGRITNLRGNGVNLSGFTETSLTADFNLIGLPDFSDTFIFLDLDNFNSSARDILSFINPGRSRSDIGIIANLVNLGNLTYRGKFTGFIDDFVAYGELSTDLGTLISDLSLQPDSDNILNFNGRLRALHFDAGSLVGSDQIGRITFNAGGSGQISGDSGISANLDGVIDSVFFSGYSYQQVQLAGELTESMFSGSAYINDPNVIMEFIGSIDFTEDIPEFDFSANVSGARLHELKLEKEDPGLQVSFFTTVNFSGDNIDNLNGRISLVNAVFKKEDQTFEIKNVSLEASGTENERRIILSSSLADAEIHGSYEFASIRSSLIRYIANYIPAYSGEIPSEEVSNGNNFSLKVYIKDTEGFTNFFIPGFQIAAGTVIEGKFDPASHLSMINGSTQELRLNRHTFSNLRLNSYSVDSVFHFNAVIDDTHLGDALRLENLSFTSGVINDSIGIRVDWKNRDQVKYSGELFASVKFEKVSERKMPLAAIDIFPSEIIIADSLWNISRSRILIDTSSYEIDNFMFGKSGQSLHLNGKLSEDPADSLQLEFRSMELEKIELITSLKNFELSGIVTGITSLSDIYQDPKIKADLVINDLYINNQDFGNMALISQWDNTDRSIAVKTTSDRGTDRIINIEGRYLPDGGLLDFDIELSKINLRTFDGYLDEVFANPRGLASGELRLGGNIRQPVFNGNVLLQKASFMVDYLKTQYNFTHEVEIRDNNILFSDLRMHDVNHNSCMANGKVTSNYFRDFELDIYLYPDRFMVLNTIERDNELFYGRVNASGLVHITGPTDNIMMNISARTNRNTQFFIPLQKSSEIGELTFINFTGNSNSLTGQEEADDIRRYEVNLSGIQLNFDLDITPDAEVQIIFDSKIGDIIRGRGNGSFKMEINTIGQFNMFGEYEIEQGDYLFTLQNVINKRFDIERGSRISWNGDPSDASIDMNAVYRLRAPLNTLMAPYSNGIVNEQYTRRIPVECHISMKNKLMLPEISFNIDLPTADPDTRRDVQGILYSEEKRNRQFLSLLVINNFLPEQDFAGAGAGSSLGMSATEASITTVSEFFSNQLSNWLSQLSRDVDFGVNWRPGDEITPDEVELALSTQVLNDRVSINGHVDVGGRQTSTSNIVGDFDVDIKLNRSGKLRLKAFTRANDNLTRPHLSPYTQGVGLFYREEFDNFDELINRYWGRIMSARKEEDE